MILSVNLQNIEVGGLAKNWMDQKLDLSVHADNSDYCSLPVRGNLADRHKTREDLCQNVSF